MKNADTIDIDEFVKLTKRCYRRLGGDSGEAKCFFCPGCVLGIEERVMNLKQYIKDIGDEKC